MTARLKDDQPIFIQIAELIETSIADETYLAHDQVPSTNEFAKHYQINPATAAKGINLLVDQGILYKKRGVGMFVTDEAKEIIFKKRRERFYDHFIIPLVEEAKMIQLTKDQLINWIEEELKYED
ncbi:GntR family transcriptional regulator [Amphibacillus xylanus]|uniref:Putative GntR family transcriptional regulator n=1 Tax=Amphibacillus xylanus (strain ATCC 51415 / DSM 6626 / JCM 7361 / LMG 17667 / NBRC 15112 / Ep01) TaxID=698758 RepID=K0IX29_AMPXN|nr:GntR family transcriptional regulator [Amphibacillus xylanus]BAM47000.1 putative GntR family transcriptional regulator [Amphibacillus xylanus NBRC 15112]